MHSTLNLILQVAIIILVARLVGFAFRMLRQPQVMGEMSAGILLGPSFLGWLAPDWHAVLFPPERLSYLHSLSQLGVLLFMFLVGLELDPKHLVGRGRTALVTSAASIAAPFALGALLALALYGSFAPPGTRRVSFTLFMGAAMSVTAFPVLARILSERGLTRTKVGSVTIACAALADVAAWVVLAGVVALARVQSEPGHLIGTLLGTGLYVMTMLTVVRPLTRRIEVFYRNRGRIITQDLLAFVLLLFLTSAWITEWLGIHALFGAFLLGAVLPKDPSFVRDLRDKLEDLTVVFLLPLFFADAGLRTRLGLLDGVGMWAVCGVIMVVAVIGKLGGTALAARWMGLPWREAGAIGVLMNTRGLMELVILTIGLELGILSPALFAMMVLMALVTTFMTTPVLERVYPAELIRREVVGGPEAEGYSILIPVSLPSAGPDLVHLAATLARGAAGGQIYALHLARASDRSFFDASVTPAIRPDLASLEPLLAAAKADAIDVHPLAFVSREPGADITAIAHAKGARLILMGWHKPVLSQSILGGTVNQVMREARCDVAVYVRRRFEPVRRVLVPYRGFHDRGALELARRMAKGSEPQQGQQAFAWSAPHVTILHLVPRGDRRDDERLGLSAAATAFEAAGIELKVIETDDALDSAVAEARRGYDLVIVGVSEELGLEPNLFSTRHERFAAECPASLLIVRKYERSDPTTDALKSDRRRTDTPVPRARVA